ncbi:MAG: hypothetical protein ACREML_05040, partial [Vulcanimicrobiaceae bacterium]
ALGLCMLGAMSTPFLFSAPVSAAGTPLVICNRSSAPLLDIAVGYYSSGVADTSTALSGPFVSTGWSTGLLPGQCRNFANPFNARYIFWWGAARGGINTSGSVWATNGNDHFCVPNVYGPTSNLSKTFTFEDENESQTVCESKSANPTVGHNLWVTVRKVDLPVNPTVDFDGQ